MQDDDTRWLVYDRRSELVGKPGTHALVIGVSAYPYLSDGPEELTRRKIFGLDRKSVV